MISQSARKPMFVCTALCVVAGAISAALAGLHVDYVSFAPAWIVLACLAGLWVICARRRLDRVGATVEIFFAVFLINIPILIMTYAANRMGMPLADNRLAALDRALFFDWNMFIRLIDRSRSISLILQCVYNTLFFQIFFTTIGLSLIGQVERARKFVIALIGFSMVSCLICIAFPAMGTFTYYDMAPSSLNNINSMVGFVYHETFLAVRQNPDFLLSLKNASGIVTFPSGHAAAAILVTWAGWQPLRLRLPLLFLNVCMLVATVSHGAHYLIDVCAGVTLAILAIVATEYTFSIRRALAPTDPVARAAAAAMH